MTPAPNRRWFRYSLRTLFVVVTVFSAWLALGVHKVREREKILASEYVNSTPIDDLTPIQVSCPS